MNMHNRRTTRHGFTLVELLVVITIIGVLMAILVPTIWIILARARSTSTGVELDQLAKALEAYKLDAGEYPPNFDDPARVMRHLALRWPNLDSNEIAKFNDPSLMGKIGPDEALVFWLGGRISPNPLGLVDNKIQPLSGPGEPKRYMEFDQARFRDADGDGWKEYAGNGTMDAPYIYFESRSFAKYSTANMGTPFAVGIVDGTDRGSVQPLLTKTPVNYQIHSAGADGLFGNSASTFPDGPYAPADKDNVTSFSGGKTLQDARP